jgi:hypothetical protein
MSEEKDKAIDQSTIKPAGGAQDELSEKDLDKTSGGTLQVEKWIELNQKI